MPRVPFVPRDLAEPADLVAAVRRRRGGELSDLDRLLLHSPPFTQGWNDHLLQVRTRLSLDPLIREICMCGIALLNKAEYEFDGHLPELLKAGGSDEQAQGLRDPESALRNTTLYDDRQRAAIGLYTEMTRDVVVRDATFAEAKKAFATTQELVECIGVIATYNMVSRFLVALELHEDNQS